MKSNYQRIVEKLTGKISVLAERILFSIEENPEMEAEKLKSTVFEINKLALAIHQNRINEVKD